MIWNIHTPPSALSAPDSDKGKGVLTNFINELVNLYCNDEPEYNDDHPKHIALYKASCKILAHIQ
jgi:hypothetical protein